MSNRENIRGFRGHGRKQDRNNFDDQKTFNNSILGEFKKYSAELDNKHDRYERIVKISRDITIESKRIIFLLHTLDIKKDNKDKIIKEAEKRLQSLCDVHFRNIAVELNGLDPYQYTRAYCAGLQEFIEAYTFCEYSKKKTISDWCEVQEKLKYSNSVEEEEKEEETNVSEDEKLEKTDLVCLVQPIEYILGLADVTGEIMRRCINSLGSGDVQICFESCRTLQEFYSGYVSLTAVRNRDLSRKITTLRQSVLKTEDVCYNIKVRGKEAAQWGSTRDVFNADDEDEGFF